MIVGFGLHGFWRIVPEEIDGWPGSLEGSGGFWMDSDWILNFHIKLDFSLWMNEIQTGEGLLGLVS